MTQEQFEALMPFICSDLISFISNKQNVSDQVAMRKLYQSKLYAMLECENTKLWQYSTPMLYLLYEQEVKTDRIIFPDI